MQPKSPNSDYDFMLKDNQPAKRVKLPLPKLPKPVLIALAVLVTIILVIIVSSAISGRKNKNFQPFIGVLQRAQETIRVTTVVQQLALQDPQTQALAATTMSSIASDRHRVEVYLANNHIKYSAVQLAADTDKSTDSSLQAASQNNNLDAAYVNYLKTVLPKYQTDIQAAYKVAGPKGKAILSDSFESTRALLNSAPIKT